MHACVPAFIEKLVQSMNALGSGLIPVPEYNISQPFSMYSPRTTPQIQANPNEKYTLNPLPDFLGISINPIIDNYHVHVFGFSRIGVMTGDFTNLAVFENTTFFDHLYKKGNQCFHHERFLDVVQVALHDLAARNDAEVLVLISEHVADVPINSTLEFTSIVDNKNAVHSKKAPALLGTVPNSGTFSVIATLTRENSAQNVLEHPGSWSVSLLGSALPITRLADATPKLRELGVLPKVPTEFVVEIIEITEMKHGDDVKHAKFFAKIWLQKKRAH